MACDPAVLAAMSNEFYDYVQQMQDTDVDYPTLQMLHIEVLF